jgi:hypothetical protein
MHVISLKYKELGVMSGPQKDLKNPVLKGKLSCLLSILTDYSTVLLQSRWGGLCTKYTTVLYYEWLP